MFIIRNALGLQQTPPSLVLYSIALILTVFVTMPLIEDVFNRLSARPLISARLISSTQPPTS